MLITDVKNDEIWTVKGWEEEIGHPYIFMVVKPYEPEFG